MCKNQQKNFHLRVLWALRAETTVGTFNKLQLNNCKNVLVLFVYPQVHLLQENDAPCKNIPVWVARMRLEQVHCTVHWSGSGRHKTRSDTDRRSAASIAWLWPCDNISLRTDLRPTQWLLCKKPWWSHWKTPTLLPQCLKHKSRNIVIHISSHLFSLSSSLQDK